MTSSDIEKLEAAMLSLISGLGEAGLKQEWSNGKEFSGDSDLPDFRPASPGTPKISVHSLSHPESPQYWADWKALTECGVL